MIYVRNANHFPLKLTWKNTCKLDLKNNIQAFPHVLLNNIKFLLWLVLYVSPYVIEHTEMTALSKYYLSRFKAFTKKRFLQKEAIL